MDVILKSFASGMEAEMAKSLLEAHGIKCFVQRRDLSLYGTADSGMAGLIVLQEDLERSKEVLAAFAEEQ
jgi:hypothetical protein